MVNLVFVICATSRRPSPALTARHCSRRTGGCLGGRAGRPNHRRAYLLVVGLLLAGAGWGTDRVRAQAPLTRRFEQLDRDQNDRITPDELPAKGLFRRLDLNGDGAITRTEAGEAVSRLGGQLGGENAATRSGDEEVAPPESPVRQGPRPVRPGEHGVGRMLPEVTFTDLSGKSWQLGDLAREQRVVLAMTSTSCPLSRKYLPTLIDLVERHHEGVTWILVNPVASDERDEMTEALRRFPHPVLMVPDSEGRLAQACGALTTTDVIVLDRSRTVVYHGAIDDQYGLGYSREAPRQRYLADALTALQQGRSPQIAATEAPGCTLERSTTPTADPPVTYHNQIARILQRHCVECHRPDGVGPFALETYAQAVAHAAMLGQVVERGVMPPWFAAPTPPDPQTGLVHSPWANDRSLATRERQQVLDWIAAGTPEGKPSDSPVPREFTGTWQIGTPDAVFELPQPVSIPATGTMPYRHIVVETELPEDRWVQAIEIQPGERSVVHHVLVFVQEGADAGPGEEVASERGGFWAAYVPGNSAQIFPEGFAKRLPRSARLRFQLHYTPNGTATTDRTRLGVVWAKEPPRHEVRVTGIVNPRISIPPGAERHREEAVLRIPVEAQILGFMPHLHVRGQACRYELTRGQSGTRTLLDVPRYDFNWQLLYRLQEPLTVQSGDVLRFIAWFDNSENNPANPDPTRTVRWGPQTEDEMLLGYVEYFVPGAKPGESGAPSLRPGAGLLGGRGLRGGGARGGERTGLNLETLFQRLDRNGDGKLDLEELPAGRREALRQLDRDQDGAISREEAQRLRQP